MNNSKRPAQTTWTAVAAALLLFAGAQAARAEEAVRPEDAAAVQVIRGFNDTMVSTLRDSETLGYKGRFERLRPVLDQTFDLAFMAEKALGRFWKDLSEAERTQWKATFADFMTANYASRLLTYNNQTFDVVLSEGAANETAIIQTKVSEPGNDDVQLNYRMRQTQAGWRAIDIYYNGTVSELALRRADYATVLKTGGFTALIASVNRKIADMQAGTNA